MTSPLSVQRLYRRPGREGPGGIRCSAWYVVRAIKDSYTSPIVQVPVAGPHGTRISALAKLKILDSTPGEP